MNGLLEGEKADYRRRIDDIELEESFSKCPRFHFYELTEKQIEKIAEKAALRGIEMAEDKLYKGIGQSVVSKWFIIIGIMTVAFYAYMRKNNIL